MERKDFIKRILCMVLALALMVGTLPAHALSAHAHNPTVNFTQVDENGNVVVDFTQVDNDRVTAGMIPNGQTEIKDEVTYADTDVVRASIILSKSSTIEAGYSAMDITTNKDALKYRESLKLDQANMVYQIEKTIESDLEVIWKLTLAANMISVNVEYGQIEAIKKLPGVKDVVLENQYLPCETKDGTVAPNMATSGSQIGTGPVWEAGYTGAGMRIAVIDTGIDTDHQSMNSIAYMYALEQLAAQKGISKEEYIASLDLLDAEEIAAVADKLNVKIDPSKAYINNKIAFAYNYRDFDYDVTHDNDEEGDHGSHVAGIATANSWLYNATSGNFGKAMDYAFMQGVAPDAQLMAFKVFGKGGAPYDSDFFAAIEDAIVLGADAINLSLGSTAPGRGHHTNAQFEAIMDSLTESGVVVAISAGNSGSWVENADNGGYLYNTDIGMNTTGQPGAFTNSLCVGSVENDGIVGYYFTVDGEIIVYIEELMNDMKSLTTLAGEQEYIFIDGVGKAEDWAAIADVLPGKVAICSRGETNFVEKAQLATEAGAIAVMVYNNVSGIIYLDMTDFTGTAPVVSLTKKQGEIIRENSTPVYDQAGNLRYLTGTMNISNTIGKGEFSSEYYTMSDFSSWGVPGSLEMKPEISAPGGNIFSIEGLNPNGGAYAIKSGTSMASPQIAGMATLMMQYIRETKLDQKTGMDIRHLAQSLLMSTASPVFASKDVYYSILQQGAGLANIHSAITADSYITMAAGSSSGAADGKVKVELFDDPDRNGSYSATFTLHNLKDTDTTVALNADFFIQALLSDGAHLYMDTATTLINMDVVWYVDGETVTPALLIGRDFNGDGQVNMSDGQTLLNYATGVGNELSNKAKADVDGDGDIDSHDAYTFLRELMGITTTLEANDSIEIRVAFDMTEDLKETLDEDYPNGTYIQGYLYAETENTQHSIPVLGFYGNWTDASMFDVGMWPTFETEEDTRIPYTGILRGNEFQVRYANDPNYHYTLGGNPLITDEFYMPERNAINSSNYIHGIRFTPIRHADQSRVVVVNKTTGATIFDQKTGAVNMAYYANEVYGWQNTMMSLETNFSLKNTSEGDTISMAFTLVPEYYIDSKGNVDWDALGEGATRSMDLVIDNTAPELKGISIDVLNNTMTITASDNEYIAAAGLYNKTGTRRLAAVGSKQDIEKGETAEYTFSLDGINGKKFLVQVHDYAKNTATYLIEMQIGEDAGVPDMMAFDLVSWHWTTFTNDFTYDYKVGTPRLEYADYIYYAATIADHYVFASTNKGELYVMPEDDLSDTTFIVDMGVVLYDMAYNKADGNIYAVTEANNLVVIDKLSGELTKVGTMPKRTNTLACSPEGEFYFNELGTGKVWSFTLDTMNAPKLLMEDPFLTRKDPVNGDHNGTEGNMGMEYDPNKDIICWNSHIELLFGSYITFAYYYEINPDDGSFVRYNDFWHEMSCLMIPDMGGRDDSWAKPTNKISGVSLNKSSVEVIKGTSTTLVANVKPWTATNRDVTWSSANNAIATVDEYGVVTGVAPGTTTITSTSKLDPTKSATCEVTVNLLHATIEGTVLDTDGNPMFYSWNMASDSTWKPGKGLPFVPTSVTKSPLTGLFYMMDTTQALQMHKVDANGNILASADNENGIPLWDMVYSETFSTADAEKVTSIYYSYLLSAKDPMALDAVGFDLGSMCSYLVGITSLGTEQVEDEDGVSHTSEHLVMLDNDGYIWHFWVYPRESGGFDALYAINRSNLRVELPGFDNMEYMFCSLAVDENENLYLSAYTGNTNEIYYLTYDETDEMYLAVKVGDMGNNAWPATITSVTLNNTNAATAVHPEPTHTMSSTAISREDLAAASSKVRFTVTEAEKNYKLGTASGDDKIVVNGTVNADGYYEISNAADLLAFAEMVNGGQTTLNGKLMADIDMTGQDWAPIGNSSEKYAGIFDGQGHSVSNLTLTNNQSYYGLFGYVSGGTVKNVIVKDANFSGYQYVGGVIGRLESGTAENCALTGTSTVYGSCSSTTSGCYVGGVVGYVGSATVQNCYNAGAVSGNGKYVAGVVGYVKTKITLTNCYNAGTVTGKSYTAGIAGNITSSSAVSNCFSVGTVTGETSYVGAVIGSGSGTISNNYYLSGSAKIGETAMNGTGKYNASAQADTAGKTDGKDAAWFASADAVTALNNGGTAWIAGASYPVLAVFGNTGGTTPEPECQHTNVGEWQSDDTNHWKVCADCGEKVSETAHSYGDWANGKKTCACGKEIICQHTNVGQWVTDEENHWKVCADCGEKTLEAAHEYQDGTCECGKADPNVPACEHSNAEGTWQHDANGHWQVCDECGASFNQADHNFGEWANGEKSCDCGEKVICQHTSVGPWVTTDETNHWKLCNDCGEKTNEGPHSYQDYLCACGKTDPNAPQDNLILGENKDLTSGETYTYTATEDGRLSLVFDFLKDSDGARIYDYTYGQGKRVKVMLNGTYVPHIADTSHDNATKITVCKGQTITVELVSVDGGEYTIDLTIEKTEAAMMLQLGDNSIANKTEYSFIAPQDGTLYTTIKELWYDGTYCSERSLTSSVVFKINGAVVEQFKNAYEVKAGDEITVLMSANFNKSGSAVLNLSYEGFFEHAPGTRGNPYILNYADCPTNSVEIPAGTDVWYKLVGFPEGAYLTVEGANAYVYIGSSTTRINAVDGKLTVAAAVNMRVGNSGSAPATVRFSVSVAEGEQGNPKDLVEGDNKIILDASGNYYYDFVAKKPGTATFTVSGENWRFWYSFFNASGIATIEEEDHQARREDSASVTVEMAVGESIVLKLGTLNDGFTAPGGEITVTFYFTPDASLSDCEHPGTREVIENLTTPTCTVDGGFDTVTYCTACGEELSRVHTPDPAKGHTPGDEPTCTTAQMCTVCGQKVANSLGHNFVEGTCSRCGALESDNALVLGENEGLTSGNVYTYTAPANGRIELIFNNLKGSDGTPIYDYEYGKGLKVNIMVNGRYVPHIMTGSQDNPTKVTVSAGQSVTVELVSLDGGNYSVDLTINEIPAANALQLGDNEIAKKTDYSFIAPQDGTLYTTIKELWFDGGYCTEKSLTSTVVFRINGTMITQFKNSYEVKAGDEITILLGLSFGNDSARAVLNLSYEGFYEHPAGSRGNPHILTYAQCPTDSAVIGAGEIAWYRLSGFGSGYYITVTGENAYVIVGSKTYYAKDGVVTAPASTEIQIGNSGSTDASFPITAGITVGYPDNPKELQEGDNIVSLPARGNYWYDFKATENGVATITMSGENWGYQYIVYGADGSVVSYSHETTLWYQCKGDPETVDVNLLAGQTLVVKVGTMAGSGASATSPGGTVNVNFHFQGDGTCRHYSESGTWYSDDTNHWKVCDFCGEQFAKAPHTYGEGDQCVCGKIDPASQCEHTYGGWVNGEKVCSKCGNTVVCRHFTTVVKNQKDPECEKEGYTGDTHCSVCDMLIKKGTAIPATGHNYVEGTCTGCGGVDPDYRPIIAQDVVSDVDVTNGVTTITWDTTKMTLVGYDIFADYHTVIMGEGSITIGYVCLEAIAAGEPIATLYFEVVNVDDAQTDVDHEEVNNESSSAVQGDADGDGFVDAFDASLIMKYSVGAISADELNLSVLDVDGDGFVDAFDASLIQKYSVGAIDKFPTEE